MSGGKAVRIRCQIGTADGVEELPMSEAARLIREAPETPERSAKAPLVWIDIEDPGEPEARFLRDEVKMHHLAVEDCLRGRQRPKLDRYPGYFFLVLYAARINPGRRRMALNELHIFLGSTFLITVHDHDIPEVAEMIEAWRENPSRYPDSGTAAYAVLDMVVDNYFPITEHFSDRLETLEDEIFEASTRASMQKAMDLRHEMIILRRVLAPQRDVLSSLVRRELPFVRPELVPYFQDVHDHVLRVTEEIDAFRDLIAGLIEVYASNSANQLNRAVQTLTGWSIILMSMTLVAGIYGMNFDYMPELGLRWGYLGAIVLMAAIGAALLSVFRRRGWL